MQLRLSLLLLSTPGCVNKNNIQGIALLSSHKKEKIGVFHKKNPPVIPPSFLSISYGPFSLFFDFVLPPLYFIFDSGVGRTDQTRSTQKNNCSSLEVVGGKYCFKKKKERKGSRIKREEEIIYGLHGSDVSPLKLVFSKYSL